MKTNKLVIHPDENCIDQRLDKFLGQIPEIQSRSQAESLIRQGRVTLNGIALKASHKVHKNEIYEIILPEEKSSDLIPLETKLDILFEDKDLIVINKPPGVVVHPSAGHEQDTLVNMLIAHTTDLSMGFSEKRPGIVHRLDRDTSGVIVVAKNNETHLALSEKFQKRDLHRLYHAILISTPAKNTGIISSYLSRHPTDRKKFASKRDLKKKIINQPDLTIDGKWAVTHYKIIQALASGLSYAELKLETGRTHQIRVHVSEMGCPIVKDDLYGAGKKINLIKNKEHREIVQSIPRFALHARELGFEHPKTKEYLNFKTDWPEDLRSHILNLGFKIS